MVPVFLNAIPLIPRHCLAYSNQMDTSRRKGKKRRMERKGGRAKVDIELLTN